jgi:hypothetical protein
VILKEASGRIVQHEGSCTEDDFPDEKHRSWKREIWNTGDGRASVDPFYQRMRMQNHIGRKDNHEEIKLRKGSIKKTIID